MTAADGEKRLTDVATTEQLLRNGFSPIRLTLQMWNACPKGMEEAMQAAGTNCWSALRVSLAIMISIVLAVSIGLRSGKVRQLLLLHNRLRMERLQPVRVVIARKDVS